MVRAILAALALADAVERVSLVTGANKGIGLEIARKLAATPGVVVLGCRSEDLGGVAADLLRREGAQADIVCRRLELTDAASIASTRDYLMDAHGRLDVLVNNAAVCFNDPTLYGRVAHTPFEAQADITLRTNFFGTLGVTRAMLSLLRNAPSGRIINVASAAGRLRGSREKITTLSDADLTLEALEELMREFVRDAEAGVHLQRGWPNTCCTPVAGSNCRRAACPCVCFRDATADAEMSAVRACGGQTASARWA